MGLPTPPLMGLNNRLYGLRLNSGLTIWRDCESLAAQCLVMLHCLNPDVNVNAPEHSRVCHTQLIMRSSRPRPIAKLLSPSVAVGRRSQPSWIRHNSQTTDPSMQPAPSDSSEAPAPPAGDSSMIRQEDASEGTVKHQPDFNAPVDHGTSYGHGCYT